MNLFEKIFNYQIMSRLEDSGAFMVTSQERAWLKTMLQHPTAIEAFSEDTLHKLHTILQQDPVMDIKEHLLEKARSLDKQVYHPYLRTLRRLILSKNGIRLTYRLKGGRTYPEQSGFPYKLEYSMVKKEWYLLWFNFRYNSFMSTKLQKIESVTVENVQPDRINHALAEIQRMLESRKETAKIEIVPAYNKELSRILYAFSCFEKEIAYDAGNHLYTIQISFVGNEREYVLSKIRFLGKRVRVVEGEYLKRRMLESSTKALERYGVSVSKEDAGYN